MMFFSDSSDGRTLNGKIFPQPPLVFRVCGAELAVRALTENKRPRSETPLMFAPYWNCDGAGRVCQGSMRAPGKLCLEAMKPWEGAFFESEFTHAASNAYRCAKRMSNPASAAPAKSPTMGIGA